jgi:hypothetical protein
MHIYNASVEKISLSIPDLEIYTVHARYKGVKKRGYS